LLTDKQTDKQTNENRQKHNPLGGGNYKPHMSYRVTFSQT